MNGNLRKSGSLRAKVGELLRSENFEKELEDELLFPPRRVVNHLLSFLYSTDPMVKWRAVTAMGIVVSLIADDDMEAARVVMRRLMWNLNDESGGVGWGSPEAMGEIMAAQEEVADEYHRILLSYIKEDGNPLENDLLVRGVLWGLGRLAGVRPHLLRDAAPSFFPFLKSADPVQRGLAARALGFLHSPLPGTHIEALLEDDARVEVYENGEIHVYRICDFVKALLHGSLGR